MLKMNHTGKFFVALALAATFIFPNMAQASTVTNNLRITPPSGNFGGVPIGSCDLTTYVGCTIKVFTLTNTGSTPISIGGYGILSSVIDGSLASSNNACYLFATGNGWFIPAGASCTIGATLSPLTKGLVHENLVIWGTPFVFPYPVLATIILSGVGI